MASERDVSVLERGRTNPDVPAQRAVEGRLLLIGPSPPPYNGMSVATELVLATLRGVVHVAHLDTADRRGISNIGKLDLRNLLLAARHGIENLWLLLKMRPTAVYVPISQAWLPFLRDSLFLIPARLARRKIIVHLHGGYFGQFYKQSSRAMRTFIRYALGKASVAIVLGEGVADAFDDILPPERIRIVPNGIPDDFAKRVGHRNGRPTRTLLYLGALDAQKGVLDLLRALPKVKERVGALHVIFAGEWYSERAKNAAEQMIQESGIGECLDFVGVVEPEQRRQLLDTTDILVLPSRNEGQPFVILEAMAAGLPVISTSVGCIPETVRDGIEGFVMEPGDIDGLAEKIELLIREEKLRRRMGQAARQRFLEEYAVEKFAARMKAVFAEVLAGAGEREKQSFTSTFD
jgi:glycosyltransferase involved in cell wall biosynthesis